MPDGLTAALDEIRNRGYMNRGYGTEGERLFLVGAARDDVPRLLAAVDAVLEVHSAWEIRDGDYGEGDVMYQVCRECCAAGGGGQTEECASDHSLPCWPCGTVQAISRALLSTEGESGG